MKPHTIKVLSVGGLVLILSATIFNQILGSLESSAAAPELTMLASLDTSSDPHVFAIALKTTSETSANTPATKVARPTPLTANFAPYLRLHRTRVENLATHDGID